ncbi:MAG TPA: 50S ribosomal protein L4 [Candidatus Sulfotelmatobacter sp.]|nr:50S ribosomal protein L4 [Candidatus Sulfotelmatobacter sp.]
MAVNTYTKSGTKATTPAKLSKDVFGVEVTNHELIKQAYISYLAVGRANLAITKTRGLVRGGGKKPWRQKGTGRARVGSIRSPIWRGGGITFGPTGEENYVKTLNLKARRKALTQALSLASTDGKIIVIESLEATSAKTSDLNKLLLKIGATGRVLVVSDKPSEKLYMASNNMPNISIISAKYLNVYDIINADQIVITKEALSVVNAWLGAKG